MINCYLIGTTGLLIKCAELLIEQGYAIEGIISPDDNVHRFSQKNFISTFDNIKGATASLKNIKFDYLFSIANPFIIPKWLLQKPRKLAINYHDSPLPKYAGVHATSWAILNQEKIHGITWHEMSQRVDAGKILKQITFPIHENDTALSLNLRCYENAVKAFEDMLDDIERDELNGIKQNLSDRTFFALHQKPFGGGVIDWHQDTAYISRLSRALYFGSYQNNLTRAKIILPQGLILYPQKIEIMNKESGALQSKPGTIVSISENGLSVSCKDGVIRVQELLITHDYQLPLSEVLRTSGIKVGHILPVFSNKQLQYFTDFMQDASKDTNYWLPKLETSKRVNIPWPAKENDGLIFKTTINLSQKRSRAEIITYILICLNKLTHTEAISLYYADEDTQKVVDESQGLACAKIYSVHFSARDSMGSLICNVSNQLNYEKEYNKLLSVDAAYHASERANIGIQVQYLEGEWQNMLDPMTDISFIIDQNGKSVDCITAKNKEAEVLCSRLQGYFSILEQGCSETELLGNITLNTENEIKEITTWNNTEKRYPHNKPIHQLFEEQAKKTPDKIAVIYGSQQLSYKELDSKANQLAHHLKGLGVGSGALVAVAIERSLEMVISLLAILKAGGAYVPLDLDYPEDRLNYILGDTRAKVLLTTSEFVSLFSHYRGDIISLDKEWEQISKNLVVNLQHTISPNDLVYIIYTSGTTGKPKGVGNTHQGLANRLLWTHDCYRIASQDSFLYIASVGFDIAVWEMLFPLTGGASLIIPLEQEKKDIHSLIKIIDRWKVTNVHFVPSYLSLFIDSIKRHEGQSLKQIITGGEAVLNELKLKCLSALKNTVLYLAYGPTEVAISVTHWDCREGEYGNKTLIGTPIFNTQIHVLDTNLNQVPIGAIGEIFIGGVGLARGYLNKPGLTAEKFIANPFSNAPGERLYRTGDLARYLPDGNIEFIGRVDHQVKIRGFRIELGEIESAISSVSGVKQVIVLAREDEPGQKRLVAYVVPNNQVLLDEEGDTKQQSFITDIRQECSKTLPDYMRPSQIMLLAEMPLTSNGKIDRKALPKPEGREGLEAYQAPEGLIENSLAFIWKELLQVERVGRNDNFFHLGGDSIVSIHMVSRARKLGIHFDVKQIFATPTIAGIAANSRSQDQAIIPQHMMAGNVPLLPVQEAFFAQKLVNKNHYNQSMWFIPTFKLSHQDKEKLKNCLKSIYHYHDTLRLRYDLYCSSNNSNEVNGPTIPVVQYYHDGNPFFWEEIVIDTWHDDILFREGTKIQQGLDIVNGPTSRVAWFESKDGYQGMLWVVHHLLIDGVSWRILLDDLNTSFGNTQLPDKTHSYQEFSNYLRHRDDFSEVINYYQNIRKMDYSNLKLENKNKEGEELVFQHINISLSKEDTLSFIQKSHNSYNTQANDLLVTALLLAVSSYKGTYDLLLELEGHGREGELDLSRTLGWFTSMYPAYLKLSDPTDLSRCIKEIKEQLRAIPERGIGYGICVSQNKLSPIKGDLIFNYLGQWDTGKEAHKYFNFGYNSKGHEIDIHNTKPHALIIESGVQDGVLSFTFTYSNEYNKDTIVKLANAYKANLQAVINHCTNISNYGYTPSDFDLVKISQGDIDSLFNQRNIQDLYPIVPIQSGLLFQYQLNPNSDAYFVQGIFEIDNLPNVQHLKQAWQTILERYECLRSSFAYKTLSSPVQIIHKSVDILWREVDISHLTQEEQEKTLEDTILQERHEGFDIQSPPLLRFNLLRRRQNNYYLIWNQHHLLTDGWSMPIILSEVTKIYESLENNTPLSFKTRRPYKDYIAWLNKQDRSKAVAYWKKELINATPTKIGTEVIEKANYIRELFALSESQTDALAQFAKVAGVTLNSVFQAVWSLILSQHTRQEEVTFGVTVSGRSISLSGIEDMVGIFINTVPFKVEIRPHESLRDLLQRIQKVTITHQDNSYLPLSEIQATTARDLFDSIFVFENYPLSESDTISTDNLDKRFHLNPIKLVEKIEYPIGIMICPGKQINIHLHYQDNYFTREKIDNIKQGIVSICEHLQTSNMAVGNIPSIAQDTSIKLLQWNNTKADYPEGKCIHELFEKQVEETPNNIAIVYEEQELTYQQLNEKANQLAHYLRSLGVGPETPVAISVESPFEMVVGLFGILKAGGVYIPLDISHPEKRLERMLEDMRASVLLTQTNLIKKFNMYKGTVVLLDKEKDNLAHLSTLNPRSHVSPHNLAYIIFTSGSTGKPNGVMVGHKQLVNLINSIGDITTLQQGDSFIQNVPFSFDPSLWSTLWPLTQGGYLLLLDYSKLRDSEYILKSISDHSVKVLNIGPTMFRSLILMEGIRDCKTINHIIGGGEEWKYKDLQDLSEKLPACHFSNAYGPTETTIQVLTWTCKEKLKPLPSIPLGKPIANAQIYILDTNLNQLPIGASGELFIGGVGLARGYLNRPGLTAEKFIANPFSHKPGERLYRTGDLARYLPDGNIEFLGRVDDQVKIRGSRVELGEIDLTLSQYGDVKQAVVVAREDQPGDKKLVAYVVPHESLLSSLVQESLFTSSSEQEFAILSGDTLPALTEALRNHIARSLPDYMIPSFFVFLNKMPLTPNGKIDRKSLPAPDLSLRYLGKEYVAPTTQIEQELVKIWSEVLCIEKIGIHDNFFRIGGHSLLATQVISRIRSIYNVDLSLRSFFDHPTILALSQDIELLKTNDLLSYVPPILAQQRPEVLPLSFAQQRLWFLDQLIPDTALYNVPTALRLSGNLNLQNLVDAFNALITRHEILRTIFPVIEGEARQLILPHLTVRLSENLQDFSALPESQQRTSVENLASQEAYTPFDLSSGPLIRLKLLKLSSQEHIFLMTLHHIIADGWSMSIFFKELSALYNAYLEDKELDLPPLPIQYADFALWQRNWLQGKVLEAQLSYWKSQLSDIPDLLELPTDKPRPKELTYKGNYYQVTLSKEVKDKLNLLSQEQGCSLFMTLLAAFQILLHRYTRQKDIVVGSPIANRHYKEIEGLVGFFVNTLALKTTFEGTESFLDILHQVKDTTLHAYQHQDVYFDQLVDHLNVTRELNKNPVFQVEFSLDSSLSEAPYFLSGLTVDPISTSYVVSTFDLKVGALEHEEGIDIEFKYAIDLFEEETIKRFSSHFEEIIKAILNNPDHLIQTLPMLTSSEKQQLLVEWNDTKASYPKNKTIQQLFEEQVKKSPDNVAVVYKDQELTYKELNEKANQLAHYLRSLGVEPDTLVAIAVERSLEMIIGLLGILKAGGAYVPIDSDYPQERLQFMLEDTNAPIILTDTKVIDKLPTTFARLICLDEEWETISTLPSSNLLSLTHSHHLAYVIYTSGSTGKPKGVMIDHGNFLHYINHSKITYPLSQAGRTLLHSSVAFDMSITSVFLPLISGNILQVASTQAQGDSLEKINKEFGQLSFIKLTPTHLGALKETLPSHLMDNRERCFIVGGENLLKEDLSPWLNNQYFSTSSIFNEYGPTEATVGCCVFKISGLESISQLSVPIGRPISNTQIYILDNNMNPVPTGVRGEIYIGGAGLARGYLNRPDLTAEKFVLNPFANEENIKEGKSLRLYRTGDLARYLPDGNIEFLGRIDDQVKIRGFRIELGEIESTLSQYGDVNQAVMIAREDQPGDKKLVAYVVLQERLLSSLVQGSFLTSSSQQEFAVLSGDTLPALIEVLRNHLARYLPDYMLPSFFVFLSKMPLTPNGKIDRKSLPAPDFAGDTDSYVAPRNETESKLCSIWEEVLGLPSSSVGIHDDFFKLGGNSLLAIRIVSRINTSFTRHVSIQDIIKFNNVNQISNLFLETMDALEYGEI
ncbi:MAG: hypothetical protein BGO67_05225 [Alphaproteobacteria bacterium 41-28]|nr:MAG: hypothetical protein BGO67_05225 [Alphaproteobacteria bacterium 41-28]